VTTSVTPFVEAAPGELSLFEASRATTHEVIFTGIVVALPSANAGVPETSTPRTAKVSIFIDRLQTKSSDEQFRRRQ
jgi:hypothetical protein